MRLPINIFGNLQFLKGDFFNVSGSDSTISKRITFSRRIVLKKSNPVAKLVFKKLSIYTMKTSKLPFLCRLKKLGCQRKWNRKTVLIENFDKGSDFESRYIIRVKFKLNFANTFRFGINSFKTHQILKTFCFFYKSHFEKNFAFGKFNFGAFYNEKNVKIGSFVFSFTEKIWEKTGMANSFWIKKNDTSVSINQFFHNSSVFEWIFTTCQMLNQHFYNA